MQPLAFSFLVVPEGPGTQCILVCYFFQFLKAYPDLSHCPLWDCEFPKWVSVRISIPAHPLWMRMCIKVCGHFSSSRKFVFGPILRSSNFPCCIGSSSLPLQNAKREILDCLQCWCCHSHCFRNSQTSFCTLLNLVTAFAYSVFGQQTKDEFVVNHLPFWTLQIVSLYSSKTNAR